MSSHSKFLHLRNALLAAALFPVLTVAGWSEPEASAPAAPTDAAQVTPPGKILPATGGAKEHDANKPLTAPVTPDVAPTAKPDETKKSADNAKSDKAEKNSKDDYAPVELPVVKPMEIHADRDADIGHEVGMLLENNHYLQKPISADMSQRWLKNYFLALDPTHIFFLQSDIDEFTAKYGNKLGDLLLHGDNNAAAIAPAFEIFNRYMQRVKEDVTLAEKLVKEKPDFTKDEIYSIRNNKSTWAPDAAASEAIWRGQVKSDQLNGTLEKKTPPEIYKRLSKRYVSWLREGAEDDDMNVLEAYLSALTHAYDPHSDYFSPEQAQNFAIQAINHSVTGIGAVLKSDDGYATIEEVIAGGPADLDKRLQAGDKILAVGQGTNEPVDAVYMKLDKVVDMIRGKQGSMVRLVISPAGSAPGSMHKVIDIKRDKVSIKDAFASAHIIDHKLPGGGTAKFGVIVLHDFYNNTASDVAKLVQRLKKENVAGIILDFRNNGGGLLDQAVDLTGLFAKKGPVVQVRRSDNYIEQLGPDDTRQIYDGPLVVMINKMSASATEIVAAALQDYGRAIIVGDESTHGKGTVQTLIPLEQQMPIGFPVEPGPGNLKMTVQKFYRVAGGSTQQKGVVPDIILPSVLDALELGETTLPYYMTYDTVPPANYDNAKVNLVAPYLPALKTASVDRVAKSPDFNYVRQDIAFYKKKVQDSTVSLNQAARLKEQSDLKAQETQRKKDFLARKSTRDGMLDLTLDMVAQDLPAAPPVPKKPKIDPADAENDADAKLNAALNNLTDDPQLDEAVSIMTDYTRMLQDAGSKLVQANPVVAPAPPAAK